MNDKDKRLEDFFRKSMEEFNDNPSDHVWDQLEDRLDLEETLYTKVWNRLRAYLPLALLLLTFGIFSFYSFNTISKLKENNQLLQSSINNLEQTNSILIAENQTLENLNFSLTSDLKSQKEKIEEIKSKIERSKSEINKSVYQNSRVIEKLRLAEALNDTYQVQMVACANELNAFKILNKEDESMLEKEQNNNNASSSKDFLTINALSDPVRFVIDDEEIKSPIEKWQPNFSNLKKEKEKEAEEISLSFLTYKYGLTGRVYNAFIENGSSLNFSKSYGIKHELAFGERWAVTHSLEYNEQEYSVEAAGAALPASILSRYPGSPGDFASVRSVKSRSKYFDTQLGVKYLIPSKKRETKYFVNPSVVWQLYLPQEFNYNLIQAQDLLVERREYVAYLGSVNLQFGLERSLNERMNFQMSLFAEKSLIDLGFDDQDLLLVGFRSSILFGK